MTGPSSAPRGERPGTRGARWETELVWSGEQHVDDDRPDDGTDTPGATPTPERSAPAGAPNGPPDESGPGHPNRAARRAAARTARHRRHT